MIDRERFEELYRQYWRYVFVLCRTRLGDTEEALDAAMEVFLRKWQVIGCYDPARATFKTWLARNTERLCIDIVRKRGSRGRHVAYTEAETASACEEAAAPLPAQLSLCLGDLDPMDRQLLLMHEIEGYTWEEIGALTGLSVWQVRRRVGQTLRRLEAQLRNDE